MQANHGKNKRDFKKFLSLFFIDIPSIMPKKSALFG